MPFYFGGDKGTLHEKYWKNGHGWTTPACNHGGYWLYEPVRIWRSRDDTGVLVVGTHHALHHKRWNGSKWSDFTSLGGYLIGPPTVSRRGNEAVDVFYLGRDRALYHLWWDGQTWSDHHRLDGVYTHISAAVSWGDDHIALFAVDLDGALRYSKWTSRFGWHDFKKLAGKWMGTPKAVSDKPGNIDVFGLGPQSNINHLSYSHSSWSPVRSMDGSWHSTPEVISCDPGRIDIFAVGFDSSIYHSFWDGKWSSWSKLGGSNMTMHPPKAIKTSVGLDVWHVGWTGYTYKISRKGYGPWEGGWEGSEGPRCISPLG
jgi:hypothetical protein